MLSGGHLRFQSVQDFFKTHPVCQRDLKLHRAFNAFLDKVGRLFHGLWERHSIHSICRNDGCKNVSRARALGAYFVGALDFWLFALFIE